MLWVLSQILVKRYLPIHRSGSQIKGPRRYRHFVARTHCYLGVLHRTKEHGRITWKCLGAASIVEQLRPEVCGHCWTCCLCVGARCAVILLAMSRWKLCTGICGHKKGRCGVVQSNSGIITFEMYFLFSNACQTEGPKDPVLISRAVF